MAAEIHRMSDYRAPANIPKALRDAPGWLVWRLVQRPGEPKPRKVPFYANGAPRGWPKGRAADGRKDDPEHPNVDQGTPLDLGAMVSYDRAVAACIKGNYTGIGWAPSPGCGIVALDFDHCIKGGKIDPRIASVIEGTYAEVSPSGTGIRAFFKGDLPSRKDNADKADRFPDGRRHDGKFDVEFFGHNGFVTVTGNATDDTELFGLEDTVAPLTPKVIALYHERFGAPGSQVVATDTGADDDLSALGATQGWSIEKCREVLFACDPDASRENWLYALMAIHHETRGSPEGLDLVDEWSSQAASKYGGRRDVEAVWNSFKVGSADHITGIWLNAWRRECQVHEKYDAQHEWKQKLAAAADEFTLREKVCPEISKDDRLDEMAREGLAQALLDAFKRTGTKYPIAQCRKLLAPKAPEKPKEKSGLPKWLEGWVYVTDEDHFYRIDSDEWLTMQGFNAKHNRELPRDEDGAIFKSASYTALEDYELTVVTRGQYLPWADKLFEMDGVKCVNLYRPSSVPKPADVLTAEGRKAVDTVLAHLRLLAGNREAVVQTLVDWLAHNVQKPSVKIRWLPLIKGFQGDGKTVLGQLVAAVMGRVNVGSVSPTVLATDFTGWARGKAVVVFEEIKLTGHNKFDIVNKLKPFITNDIVEIHGKGKDSKDEINTVNYMGFTNFNDGVPLEENDRRWMVVFTPFENKEAMAAALGPGPADEVLGRYFDRLHTAINTQGAALRRWLLDHSISQSFKPNSNAPTTEEKLAMIGMQVSEDESTVAEIIERGGPGISKTLFLSSYLSEQCILADGDVNTSTTAWNRLLQKMGYVRLPKKIKWRGKTDIVWVRGHKHLEPDEVRRILQGTLPEGTAADESSQNDDLF